MSQKKSNKFRTIITLASSEELHGIKKTKSLKEKIEKILFKKENETKIIKKFKSHGFECLIAVVNGAWYTGYVGVPKNHPFYGKDTEYIDQFVSAHGEITFAGSEVLGYKKEGIWWIGIDFAHGFDRCVGEHITNKKFLKLIEAAKVIDVYNFWSLKDVEKEIRNLAKQLKVENLIMEHL